MQRLSWLQEDGVDRTRLPFIPHQTQLQLLGFLIPKDKVLPAPVQMLVEAEGRRYTISPTGEAQRVISRRGAPELVAEVKASAGASVCVGHVAYAISRDEIIFGPAWQVRRELRRLLPELPPVPVKEVWEHLAGLAPALLKARAYFHDGSDGYIAAEQWLKSRPVQQVQELPIPPVKERPHEAQVAVAYVMPSRLKGDGKKLSLPRLVPAVRLSGP